MFQMVLKKKKNLGYGLLKLLDLDPLVIILLDRSKVRGVEVGFEP